MHRMTNLDRPNKNHQKEAHPLRATEQASLDQGATHTGHGTIGFLNFALSRLLSELVGSRFRGAQALPRAFSKY